MANKIYISLIININSQRVIGEYDVGSFIAESEYTYYNGLRQEVDDITSNIREMYPHYE